MRSLFLTLSKQQGLKYNSHAEFKDFKLFNLILIFLQTYLCLYIMPLHLQKETAPTKLFLNIVDLLSFEDKV